MLTVNKRLAFPSEPNMFKISDKMPTASDREKINNSTKEKDAEKEGMPSDVMRRR